VASRRTNGRQRRALDHLTAPASRRQVAPAHQLAIFSNAFADATALRARSTIMSGALAASSRRTPLAAEATQTFHRRAILS